MRSRRYICIFGLLLLAIIANAQDLTTQGRDFWVSFLPNWPGTTPKLEILVAGQRPCTGIAKNPRTGWSTTFSVTPGVVTSIVVPNSEGLMEKENKVDHKAIHVTTTDDVSLYASNFFDHSYDVANVLPTAVLKDNYIAQSYDVGALAKVSINDEKSKMLIVAVEDNTEITIDPKGGLRGEFLLFSKKKITLNAGECYLCFSAKGDISGTTVKVKGNKKVAVFSGGDTQIPYDGCCYDAVFEQCVPLAYWGRHFVVTASAMRTKDVIRITSLTSGCRISIDGKHRKTLGANKYFDYTLDGSKKEAIYISASSPVSVCLYLTSASMGGIMGDPSMVNINPIEQQMDKVTFCSYNTAVSKYHYVNIVTQTNQKQGMTLDGNSIASEFKPVPKKNELSYARVSIAHGSHTLESSEGGFVAHIYGLGPYESYAYTIGSNSKVLNQFDEEGNLILSNIPDAPDGTDGSDEGAENGKDPLTYTHTDTLKTVELGSITLNELRQKRQTNGIVKDPDGLIVDPERFDITVESDYDYLFDKIMATIDKDTVSITFHPHNEWCDCFVPKKIKADIILVPKFDEGDGTGRIILPTVVPVTKETSWISRCLWVLVLLGGMSLFILYLLLLMRKRRFKKNAVITATYYDYYGNKREGESTNLRKEGFSAWVTRWFLPGDERNTLSFDKPATSLRFVAAESYDVVNIPKEGNIDPEMMHISGYNPQKDHDPQNPVRLGDRGKIRVMCSDGTDEGFLVFNSGDLTDGMVYRIVLGVLLIVSTVAFVGLVILMIRGLL